MSVQVFLAFSVAVFAATAAAVTGRRGQVCERGAGYVVPAVVEADAGLNKRANDLVARWCTAAAALAAVPLLGLAINGIDRTLPLWVLAALAAYGFLIACVGGYPFELIRRMGGHEGEEGPRTNG